MLEIHVNFASAEEADRVARRAVAARLAASANIHGAIRSHYWWDDAVRTADEVPVVFKTSDEAAGTLMAFLDEAHSYETPSIVAHRPHGTTPAYAAWVAREARAGAE